MRLSTTFFYFGDFRNCRRGHNTDQGQLHGDVSPPAFRNGIFKVWQVKHGDRRSHQIYPDFIRRGSERKGEPYVFLDADELHKP